MAGPIASSVVLPDDVTNSGKKIQTQYETIGGDAVHAHFFVPRSRRKILGIYHASMTVQSVQASAQNQTSTGFAWLQMPTGGSVGGRLRRLAIVFSMTGEADMLSVPRIAIARFTFTGTASGASVSHAKRATGDAAATAALRTAVTGMTVTAGAVAWGVVAPTLGLTTSGQFWAGGPVAVWDPPDEEEWLDFRAGEGLCLYQPDAGTAADSRRFSAAVTWDEFDNA